MIPKHNATTIDGFDTPNEIWESKVGYDFANKRMIAKVYKHLYNVVNFFTTKPTWKKVVTEMLIEDDRLNEVNVNGYYSTIRKNLKDIGVIEYYKGAIIKGSNWDRFYSDEDWNWFVTNTNSGGYGTIVK